MWDLIIHSLQGPAFSLTLVPLSKSIWDLRGPASSLALVPLFNRCGISQSTPIEVQRSPWHSFLNPIDVGSLGPSVLAGTRSSSIDVGSHNPLPSGSASSLALVHLFNRYGISQFTPLWGLASSLTLVPLFNWCGISQSTLLRGLASSLTHYLMFGSDTIYNSPSPPLADIIFLELSFWGFLSRFLKCVG